MTHWSEFRIYFLRYDADRVQKKEYLPIFTICHLILPNIFSAELVKQ